jgi:hypothetical protein
MTKFRVIRVIHNNECRYTAQVKILFWWFSFSRKYTTLQNARLAIELARIKIKKRSIVWKDSK